MRLFTAISLFALFISVWPCAASLSATPLQSPQKDASKIPESAELVDIAELKGVQLWRHDQSLFLKLDSDDAKGSAEVPRIAAPLRSLSWAGVDAVEGVPSQLTLNPERKSWVIQWSSRPAGADVIHLLFGEEPRLMHELEPVQAQADGSLYLSAHEAQTEGEKIRYEPQSFKNTIGYWVGPRDQAMWTIHVDSPGRFNVAILQGCGAGQGGSAASIELRRIDRGEPVAGSPRTSKVALEFLVQETGHFQNFQWRHLSSVELAERGDYEVRIRPVSIKHLALMDVRAVHLTRLPQ